MESGNGIERFETVVVGGGQAGLSVGYHLARRGVPFVILDANDRVGHSWRRRWDSLRLFTPARYDGLHGMPFPGRPGHEAPTKDEMADYLEDYAARFGLPIRTGVRVDGLSRTRGGFTVSAGARRFEAEQVVVATGAHHEPRVPPFAGQLDPGIVQIHSNEYKNPSQLRPGGVLIVGAGNSGADIALEVVRRHPTWLSGRDVGHVPFRIDGLAARFALRVVRFIGYRVLTLATP